MVAQTKIPVLSLGIDQPIHRSCGILQSQLGEDPKQAYAEEQGISRISPFLCPLLPELPEQISKCSKPVSRTAPG